jgi:hypothetical protein
VETPWGEWLRKTIKAGSVYYFAVGAFSSDDPHFFIVLNPNPSHDLFIATVVASSRIEKVRRRSSHLPPGTLVIIKGSQYTDFTEDYSIIDGNHVHRWSIDELAAKADREELIIKADMNMTLIKKIRTAVKLSPMVEEEVMDLFLVC